MKIRKIVLAVMLTMAGSTLMLGATFAAEQGAAKDAEGSPGSSAGAGCCQQKEAQGKGMDCCQQKETQGKGMDCCQQKEAQAEGKSCCAKHEDSHGAGHEGSHGEDEAEEGSH